MTKIEDEAVEIELAPTVSASTPTPFTFNFTIPVELMDDQTKSVYYRLRRVALMAPGEFAADVGKGDPSMLPDGKVYTESQVIEILGEDYASGPVINAKCCG